MTSRLAELQEAMIREVAEGSSDYELGIQLLALFIAAQANDCGLSMDSISEEFAERVRQYVLTAETDTAKNVAVEKALHKAASGDPVSAGKILREHMRDGAVAFKYIPIGITKSEQAANFGRKGADGNKQEGQKNRQAVLDAAKKILAERKRKPSDRQLAKLVECETGIPFNTVRGHIAKLREDKLLD